MAARVASSSSEHPVKGRRQEGSPTGSRRSTRAARGLPSTIPLTMCGRQAADGGGG